MSAFFRNVVFASALFSALSLLCASGHAQTSNPYKEALAKAYRSNPQLQAERARQRSTDEGVARALGGFRPTITVIGEAGRAVDEFRTRNSFTGATNITDVNRGPRTVQLLGRQPIYDGGQAISDYRRSEAIVEQGRARLISVEQSVLQDAAQAYVDVARDYKIVQLTRDNVDYLTELKTAIEARFNVRDVTNTDVAQSEARPNCVIGCLPDHSVFMVQDRKKLRPGVVGGRPGVYAFASEICGLDAAIPNRDKLRDFQPMHLDTVVVGPDRQEVSVCSQTDPLPLLH